MTKLEQFDYEGELEYNIEKKIQEYDMRIDQIIRIMVKTNDFNQKTIDTRIILEKKRRENIDKYTLLFLNTYPYESKNPLLEAQEILAKAVYNDKRKK